MHLDNVCIWMFRLWGVDLGMLEGLERTVYRSSKCRKDWRLNLKKGKTCV